MALPQMLEGTWEEIKQHDTELAGLRLRVYINPEVTVPALSEAVQDAAMEKLPKKKLSGFGKYAHIPGGSEAFALKKQKEIEREDRKFK